MADLHAFPFAQGDAEHTLWGSRLPARDGNDVCALNLGFHLDPCTLPGSLLAQFQRYATRCCKLLLSPGGGMVFTYTERLDGDCGSVDPLVIRDSTRIGQPAINLHDGVREDDNPALRQLRLRRPA